jgi:outer membrane biosynthesis protein TonB
VLRPSGNEAFDKIVTECVRDEWEFTPAIRKGKKVRCMVQQLVWYKWTNGSPVHPLDA